MSFFSNFFGDKDLENIDARIDNLINSMPDSTKSIPSDNISGEFIDEFIRNAPQTEIENLLQTVSVSRERLERYNVYDETYKYVPIIKRIMSVYIANILQKNPVTGKCLLIRESENTNKKHQHDIDNVEKSKKLAEECIKTFDLILKLRKKILPNQLVYGDCFCEIINIDEESKKPIDSNSSISSISSVPLFETEIRNIENNLTLIKNNKLKNDQFDKVLEKISECFVEVEIDKKIKKQDDDNMLFNEIIIKIHKPHKIIILETEHGSLLGYLVVTTNESPNQNINLTQSLSTLVGKITTINGLNQKSQDSIIDRIVRYMLKTILFQNQKAGKLANATTVDEILSNLPHEVYFHMKRLFVEQGLAQKGNVYNRLKVRFVSTANMLNFSNPSSEHDPYGHSFIDGLVFPCKLYILSQLSNVIIKLSRAAPVRKWTLDIGQSQMQASMIQKLKRELYNTRITLDDLNSFKSIPKILSDFKDMFILSKGGQKAIDVEIASHGDPTVRTADLEDSRREIMSLSGVPPAYLGYADVIELREQLVHTNVSFATEISDIQEGISANLTKLIDIIAKIKKYDFVPSNYIQITLIPPIVLMVQLIEMTLSSIGNMFSAFQSMQIPADPYFLLEKYIPYINWDSFKTRAKKFITDNEIDTELKTIEQNQMNINNTQQA